MTAATLVAMVQVERTTAAIRGLQLHRPVPVVFLSSSAFTQLVTQEFTSTTGVSDQRNAVLPLQLLGGLSPDINPASLLQAAQVGDSGAYYDAQARRILLPSDGYLSLNDRVTLSHEYTHALQDAAFDLTRVQAIGAPSELHDTDRNMAVTALIEGDADAEMQLYAQTTFSQQEYEEYQHEVARAAAHVPIDTTPPLVRDRQEFPYTEGDAFVQYLLQQDPSGIGFSAVNAAFAHPPLSTWQIMNPALYSARPSAPLPDLPPPRAALPPGWVRLDSDVVGAYRLQDLLRQGGDRGLAMQIAGGWRADRYSLYGAGAAALLLWHLHTDAAGTAGTLQAALRALQERRVGGQARVVEPGMLGVRGAGGAAILRVSGSDLSVAVTTEADLWPLALRAVEGCAANARCR